jgi:hypothetical protein
VTEVLLVRTFRATAASVHPEHVKQPASRKNSETDKLNAKWKLAARLLILNKFPCLLFRWNCFRAFSHLTFRKASGKKSNVSGGG